MARRPRQSTEVDSADEGTGPGIGVLERRLPEDEEDDCGHSNEFGEHAEEGRLALGTFMAAFGSGAGVRARARVAGGIFLTNARDGLNLRSGPGAEFHIIRSLPFGTRLHLISRENRWGLVDEQGDGAADGFVHLAFLTELPSAAGQAAILLSADQVRAFWADKNPRGAKLYDGFGNPRVDPSLLHASAVAITRLEAASATHRYEVYGPGSGFRSSGSTQNHGAQPATGRGSAIDFVIIDRRTGRMLTNHPGSAHQNQGTVGENAPIYQSYYNEVVRAGSQLYPGFDRKARFGGYFKSGSNAMDTMHIDMRGEEVGTAGGSLRQGFTEEQMDRFNIPENRPYFG